MATSDDCETSNFGGIIHPYNYCIIGLSISPKYNHYILKLWVKNKIKTSSLNNSLYLLSSSKFTSFSYKT